MGDGADSLKGGDGNDDITGVPGEDTIDIQDLGSSGIGERDVVDCGPGHDRITADFEDEFRRCEEAAVGGF
ncbi:MAG TPA: hypothetical protein VF068_07260 [Rubrobacter sp.]